MSACFCSKPLTTDLASPDPAKHVNYVRGMVLEVDEFTQEFAYHAGRDRWLAREAIGYGTLRGLALTWETDAIGKLLPQVRVTAGTALSPSGQLIGVPNDQCADINLWLAARDTEISAKFAAGASSGHVDLYVTLAYADCPTDDAPVPGEPCRSAEELMQPARISDSFRLELAWEAPIQAEEDAVRAFVAWWGKIVIDPAPGKSVAIDDFAAAARGWASAASDPASLTISNADLPTYTALAIRLWVTELRVAVEPGAALQRFRAWLAAIPDTTGNGASHDELLAEIRRWTPRTQAWTSPLKIGSGDKAAVIAEALVLWDKEIAPKWYAGTAGCRVPDYSDDRLLLGQLSFNIEKSAGNSWRVMIPDPVSAASPTTDQARRPCLGHLRLLQEGLAAVPRAAAANSQPASNGRVVAMGRLKANATQAGLVIGDLKITEITDGEVRFTFGQYSKPDDDHDYVIDVHASYTGGKSEPAVRFGEFADDGFSYKVTRANKGVLKAELEKMEFQVSLSIIEQTN